MSRSHRLLTFVLLGAVAVLGLYGCGDTPTPTPLPPTPTATPLPPTDTPLPPTNTPEPTADASGGTSGQTGQSGQAAFDLMQKAAEAMKEVKSMHFVLTTESGTSGSVTGEGDIMPPDNLRLVLGMGEMGNAELIQIGQDTYFKLPGSEAYTSLGASNPISGVSELTNPQELGSLSQQADSATIAGDEQIEGSDTTHISFTYDLNKAATGQTGAAATSEKREANGDMWIEKDTNYIKRLKFVTPNDAAAGIPGAAAGGTSNVIVTYSRFNEPIEPPIEKPTNIMVMPNIATPTP